MHRVVLAGLLAMGGLLSAAIPAYADDAVVVPGTSFPTDTTYLSWFGCSDLFSSTGTGPTATIEQDPAAPLGARATRLAVPAPGTATGPVSRVGSVADATWSLWANPAVGGQGVGHVWYVSAELEEGEVWAGRIDLAAAAGQWQQVDPAASTYTWTKHVAATGEVLERAGSATVDQFTATHGDGPGYVMAGFGCDGQEFAVDALAVGAPGTVTTYDLEGIAVATVLSASAVDVAPGTEVTLTGTTLDTGQRAAGAPLVLEARPQGAADFVPVPRGSALVGADESGQVVVTVTPEVTTEYRWFRPATGYADEGWSEPVEVRVTP